MEETKNSPLQLGDFEQDLMILYARTWLDVINMLKLFLTSGVHLQPYQCTQYVCLPIGSLT